ncbi:esterase family protein [Enterococcus faecium]|nr:esterase family protein [Enterococcus faecium]
MYPHDFLSIRDKNVIHRNKHPGALAQYKYSDILPEPYTLVEDEEIVFRLYYPNAHFVSLEYGSQIVDLVKKEYWEGRCKRLEGFQAINIEVDGNYILNECLPICIMENQPCNYINLNDNPRLDIPTGSIATEFFYSKEFQSLQRVILYLPPQYYTEKNKRFPVLYLQHGHGENETAWLNQGNLLYICDELIFSKKMVPMIIVMSNGMNFRANTGSFLLDFSNGFERMLVHEIIPLIDDRYRTLCNKKNRGMAGLSMGSLQTSMVTMKHQEIFSCVGLFSGFVQNPLSEEKDYLSQENLLTYSESLSVYFRSIGNNDEFYSFFENDDAFLEKNHITSIRKIYKGGHEWNVWKHSFMDFVQLIFKEEK